MTCHSSWVSTSTDPARRSSAAGLGKTPTTSVRRLISLFTRSSGFVDQIFFQCATGKSANAVTSMAAAAQHLFDFGNLAAQHAGDDVELLADVGSASGWAKIVRIAAATISAWPLGT